MKTQFVVLFLFVLASGCAVSKNFNPATKYAPDALQKDYAIFQDILEHEHPGLYWYATKDSIDAAFAEGRNRLRDSLTETGFRTVLSYVIAHVHCGHTSVAPSKQWSRAVDSLRRQPFPLILKIWPDTAIVTANLNQRDSVVRRGAVLLSIEGRPMQQIIDSLFQYLPADGYNLTHKYQTLSNRGTFGAVYTAVFGAKRHYNISFCDTSGTVRSATVTLFQPRDTTKRKAPPPKPAGPSRRERKKLERMATRSLRFDTAFNLAVMDLNSFTKDARLHHFFKSAFKKLRKHQAQNLVIDLRGNGGGSVSNSNLLAKYLVQKPFKVADSLYAVTRHSRYGKYQQDRIWNTLFLLTMTRKKGDGHYHFRYFEKHYFKPKQHNHFDGTVYILTGGNTFSASTLFIQSVKAQANVIVVGEETGGGAYGNNAWLIPDVTLPHTRVRFRLPLLRLVIDTSATKGQGVLPEVPVGPTVGALRRSADYKMDKVRALVREKAY